MTVDTAVKIEGDKCGLDMRSSCEDLPPTSVGDGGCECNGDSKDDYVFVNGSDAASDDHVEVEGNRELNVSESNADFERTVESNVDGGDQLEKINGASDTLGNVVEVEGGESELENGIVVEEESDGKVDGGELVQPNGEIKSESDGVVEGGKVVVENADSNHVEGKVDVKVRDLEVMEKSGPKCVVDEVKDGESGVEKGDDSNAWLSLVDDDKTNNLSDIGSGSDMVFNGTTVVEAEPQVPHGEIEEQLHLGQFEEPEKKLKDEVSIPEVIEDNVSPQVDEVTETELVDGIVMERKVLEADVEQQCNAQEDSLVVTLPPNGDVKAPDSEAEEFLVDDAITEKQSADCQQQDLQPVDSKELDLVEAEAEVKEQGDVDPPGMSGSQDLNSLDSEVAVCEKLRSDENEDEDQDASDLTTESEKCQESQTVPGQYEGAENQSNVKLTASEVDQTTIELKPEVTGTLETSTVDMQSDKSDKTVVDPELDRVHGEGKSEFVTQEGGSLESSVQEVSFQDHVAEETGLVGVVEREDSSEDISFKKTLIIEEEPNLSKPKAAIEAAAEEDGKVLHVSENEVDVPESSHDSGSCLRSENGDLTVPIGSEVDLLVPDESDIINKAEIADGSYAGDHCIGCPADESSSQPKLENSNDAFPSPVNGSKSEVETVNGDVDADVASKKNFDSEETLKPKISFGSFDCITPFSHSDNINIHTDVLNRSTELITGQSDFAGDNSESNVDIANGVTFWNSETNGVHSTELNHDKTCAGVVSTEQINTDEVSAHLEVSGADSFYGQNVNPDLVRRPFYYLIRIPRFDDVKLSEEIKQSEIQLDGKTQNRDAVRIEYQKRKASYWECKTKFEAARSEERAAHKLMIAKKREIDSAHSLINFARNAIKVEDVDSQILNMERRIQHETMGLAEEKRLVREIKQLNHQREQLAADTRRQQELQQALDRRIETEEQLKVLRKELDALRENHAKAEESFKAAKKKYDEESALLKDLNEQFRSVDTIRQEEYANLQSLKKQAFEKNKLFYNYKDDAKAANSYAVAGEKESLEQHCVNQVERFMELWNKNDEFRKEYIRCNMRSTLRRLRTLDGRSLGPDEEPPSLRNASDNRINPSAKISSVGTVLTLERDFPLVVKTAEEESAKKVIKQTNKTALVKKRGEILSKNSVAEPSGRIEIEEKEEEHKVTREEEEHRLTKEEEELARKAEQKRIEEEAARLREQRRLEEKAKAQEAQERKERMAKKAQARAEFRARKEAEEKEKEKEKRAKKKGKKKGFASEIAETEPAELPESLSETIREPEVTEKPVTLAKKSHKPALYTKQVKTTKSISSPPAPLRNRGKRRVPQWAWWLVLAVLIVALVFPLGNLDNVRFLKTLVSGSSHK